MEININQNGFLELTKVFNNIYLRSEKNEEFAICMADSGFEFLYNNRIYEAKEGKIRQLGEYKFYVNYT